MASGTGTITTGNTYVTVTHGLGLAPSLELLDIRPQDDLAGRSFWASNLGATTFRINMTTADLGTDHDFGWSYPYTGPGAGGVTVDCARNRFKLTVTDISDAITTSFLDDAVAEINHLTGLSIVKATASVAEANAVCSLAACYCYCYVTGGTAVGLTFSLGDISISEASHSQFNFLLERVKRFIETSKVKDIPFVVAQDDADLS